MDRKKNDAVVRFLYAKWLLKERMLDNAFEQAKRSFEIDPTSNAQLLMTLIKEEKKNKGKIKVKVENK